MLTLPSESVPSTHSSEHAWLYMAAKEVDWHSCVLRMTFMQKGQRNMMPECSPVPRPIDESTPSTTHHRASYT